MSRAPSFLLAFVVAITLARCDTQPLSESGSAPGVPTLEQPAAKALLDVPDGYVARPVHLVRFDDGIPENFGEIIAQLGGDVWFLHAPTGIAVIRDLTSDATTALAAMPGVGAVVEDESFEFEAAYGPTASVDGSAVPTSPASPTAAARYPWQWNMRAVHADEAWAAGRLGSPAVTIAVLDTGLDYLYPDLAGRVDLTRSVSFVPFDDALVDAYFPGRHYITDLYFHGTHVGMTAVSNAYILAGVTSQPTLMGVKVCSVAGGCAFSGIIMGVLHAADHGADVANMSLGGMFEKPHNGELVGLINRVFTYANSMGMSVVVSAGNDALDLDHDRSGFKTYCSAPNVICVSATGPSSSDDIQVGPWYEVDDPAPYTNYGRSAISVAAPGGTAAGYVWSGCPTSSLIVPLCQTGIYILGSTGTSMAAPHVSGLASLFVEAYGRNPGRLKAAIQQSADDLGRPGVDPFYGKGRINVGAATN